MTERAPTVGTVFSAIERTGLVPRGAFLLEGGAREAALAGPEHDRAYRHGGARWLGRVRGKPRIARRARSSARLLEPARNRRSRQRFRRAGAVPVRRPPYWPFQQWARRAEPVHPSPIGVLIHPRYGLWHRLPRRARLSRSPRHFRADGGRKVRAKSCRALVLENLPRRLIRGGWLRCSRVRRPSEERRRRGLHERRMSSASGVSCWR